MHRNKKTSITGIIITIVILIVIVIVSNIKIEDVGHVESGFGMLVIPIQNGLTYLKNWMSGNNSFFTNVDTLQEENQKLKQQNRELEKQYSSLRSDANRLVGLLVKSIKSLKAKKSN